MPANNVLVIVRTKIDIDLFGGPESYRLSVGSKIALSPACDLWMRGAKFAEVRGWSEESNGVVIRVRPLVSGKPIPGKLHKILPDHVAGFGDG